ncbi:pentapeptide repeat-containing protein [Maricaulis sp.]|uniref:pentapeptide repeat-containing protein n=1 Tax=Maricaulis sp. TaxID=1486257 RepID=UPI0025C50859|nr:pentapeptide repeat-containing protein [Maricaulis sp.]
MDDEARKAERKKAIEDAWWKRWREQDFSWDGLAALDEDGKPKHAWQGWSVTKTRRVVETKDAPDGSRPATLQDYFRRKPGGDTLRGDPVLRKAGLLIDGAEIPGSDGKTFHIIHCPKTLDAEDTTTTKALDASQWETLESEVDRLIALGEKTDKDYLRGTTGTDKRTQLSGVILRRFPRPPAPEKDQAELAPLHLTAPSSAWLDHVGAESLNFASELSMYAAIFFADADFRQAQFSGGDASFHQAQFSGGYASFYQAQFSGGDAYFGEAQFSGGDAYFGEAQFSGGYAYFNQAQFSGGNAYFRQAQFSRGYAYFGETLFLGSLNLQRGDLEGLSVGYLGATVDASRDGEGEVGDGPDVSRERTDIWLTTPAAKAEAGTLTNFNFEGARVFGTAFFTDRIFAETPDFSGARFFGRADFHGASLHESVQLKNARFRFGTPMRPRRFPGFDRAWRGAYTGLRSWLRLPPVEPPDHIRFPEQDELWAEIEARANKLDRPLPDKAREQFDKTYATAKQRFDDRGHEANLYENEYRTLKRLMARIGASSEEQRFFALELKARQARRRSKTSSDDASDQDVTAWEAFFAGLYGAVTDYGQSLTRVLGWMGGVWAVSAAAYLILAVTAPPLPPVAPASEAGYHTPRLIGPGDDETVSERRWTTYWRMEGPTGLLGPALYALEMTVVPVVNPGGHHPWTQRLEGPDAGGHAYWFALVRLVHRLLALPLAFLFLLTLRRRFQIS